MDNSITIIIIIICLLFSSIIGAVSYFMYFKQVPIIETTPVLPTTNTYIATATTTPTPTRSTPPPTTPAPYSIGQSISCSLNDVSPDLTNPMYRYDGNNTLRLYPNKSVAETWDPDFIKNNKTIDCKDLVRGVNMPYGSYSNTVVSSTGVTTTLSPQELSEAAQDAAVSDYFDTNYQNIPDSCYSKANEGECGELQSSDTKCYAIMKDNGEFIMRKITGKDKWLPAWRTGTGRLAGQEAKFKLSNTDGRLRVVVGDTTYYQSPNDVNSTEDDGPFNARIVSENDKCKLQITNKNSDVIFTAEGP